VAGSGKKQLTCPSPAWGSDKPATSLVLKLYKGDLKVDSRQSADQVCKRVGFLVVSMWCERVGESEGGWVGVAWHGMAWRGVVYFRGPMLRPWMGGTESAPSARPYARKGRFADQVVPRVA
jgi:hypothetical protein